MCEHNEQCEHYVTLLARKNGKWVIACGTCNLTMSEP